jgi:cytochrome d ubiquinol oxidase subunit I
MESHWETTEQAPLILFAIPDEKNERNRIEIGRLPGALSLLGHHDFSAEVTGLKDFAPEDRPPVFLTFISFRLMVLLGTILPILAFIGWLLRRKLVENRWYLIVMMLAIPLPYLAMQAGWVVAEVGRQPWIVYGLMRTSDAASPVAGGQVLSSLIAFILVYGILGLVGFYLIAKNAIKGPAPATN